jgi:hypothetical protein
MTESRSIGAGFCREETTLGSQHCLCLPRLKRVRAKVEDSDVPNIKLSMQICKAKAGSSTSHELSMSRCHRSTWFVGCQKIRWYLWEPIAHSECDRTKSQPMRYSDEIVASGKSTLS